MAASVEDVNNAAAKLAVSGLYLTAGVALVVGFAVSSLGATVGAVGCYAAAGWFMICGQALETNGYSRAFMRLLPISSFDKPPLDERKFSDGEVVWGGGS